MVERSERQIAQYKKGDGKHCQTWYSSQGDPGRRLKLLAPRLGYFSANSLVDTQVLLYWQARSQSRRLSLVLSDVKKQEERSYFRQIESVHSPF